MEHQERISVKVEHALGVERVLRFIGWSVAGLGIIGVAGFVILWIIGELDVD